MIRTFEGRIEFWDGQASIYRERMEHAEGMARQLRIEATGFEVGEVVMAASRGKWAPAIIREIEPFVHGRAWFKVSFKKVNGEWADKINNAFSDVRKLEQEGGAA